MQQLFYYITSFRVCQVLFQNFFNSYFFSSSFPFLSLFLRCLLTLSRQPLYYITFKQVCQYLFRTFSQAPVNFFSLSPDKLFLSVPVSTLPFDSFIIISPFHEFVKENFGINYFIFLYIKYKSCANRT